MLTQDQLEQFSDKAVPFYAALAECFELFHVDSPEREAMFLAQVCHESGNFHYTRELWGPTPQQLKYEQPNDLAYRLGNTQVGDGHRYLGRGLIQVTGRMNYHLCSQFLYGDDRLVDNPEMLEQPHDAVMSAGWFWSTHNLNVLSDARDIVGATKRINGGLNGLDDRKLLYTKACSILGVR